MEARLHLLDAPSLEGVGGRFGLPSSVPGVLLAYLGQRGDWVGRDTLQALFWPEASTGDVQHNLRVALHRARQWLQQASADLQREAKKLANAKWLAQGTIYPDVIESGGAKTKKATTIKSHHNVGGLPETLGLKLLEPLRDLFKDEVRELGVALGLPHDMVYRHPFPGPGLGVRILGEVKKDFADLLRRADAIFIDELRAAGWYEKTSQAFAVFLPVKSVGVMGDGRTYQYVVALRAVQTSDFMTADWAELPYSLLKKVSSRIINEVRGINRVTYDVSSKPPATIEWE